MPDDTMEPQSGANQPTPTTDSGADAAASLTDQLAQQDRIQIEARMLPMNTKLSEDEIAAVVEKYISYIERRGLPATQVARECGYSPAVISAWYNGKYRGDVDEVTRAVNQFMERDARRHQAKRPKDYIPTRIAEHIQMIAHTADKRRMMAAITVPAGAGKTLVLKALADQMNGVYVYLREGMSPRDIYKALALSLGWECKTSSRSELHQIIVERLAGTHRIVLVDEAHHAGKNIGCLRSIYDLTQCAIVMAGSHEIMTYIDDRAHGKGQFSSRTIRFNATDQAHQTEGPNAGGRTDPLFTIEEVKAFLAMKKIRVDRDATRMLWSVACLPNYGTLRTVENALDIILDADPDIEIVTKDHVVAALQLLVGDEARHIQTLARRHEETHQPAVAAMAG
jgi:DNA transposition AAA+ family ATPase